MGKAAVKERKPEAKIEAKTQTECIHHWLIESPHGATSQGRCKLCGTEREFRNSSGDYIWDDDSSSSSGSGLGGLGGVKRSGKAAMDDDEGMVASGRGSDRAAMAV